MRKNKRALEFTDEELAVFEKLHRHPELLEQVKPILDLAENTDKSLDANDIEDRLIEEVGLLGNKALGHWAKNVEELGVQEQRSKHPKFQQREKKNLWWWSRFGKIEVIERVWRTESQSYLRILPERLGVTPRGCSRRLERALSWLGADHSFQAASEATEELLGLEISKSTLRQITLKHADAISNQQRQQEDCSYRSMPAIGAKQIIAQADGSMARTVEPGLKRNAKRPRQWREIRLISVQAHGAEKPVYAASMESVERSGRQWGRAALEAGLGLQSEVHVVSDGALWIQNLCEEVFGPRGKYLVDFYHVSEYLGEASEVCRPKNPQQWLRTQQRRLKAGQKEKVFKELREHAEPETVADEATPVRAALRYLENRKDHLHYKEALDRGLPIGSGTIESGHKHVLQARLKKAGAAWLEDNLESMARLRSAKVNETWSSYWNPELSKIAA